jgi:hypothetical protein
VAGLIYKIVVLLVLYAGGYLLLRFGMDVSERTSFYIAVVAMPLATLLLWLVAYRGKKFG